MKAIKMLGLAALAALMAMAFAGPSSAMAESTLLCSTDPSGSCTAVTHVHAATAEKAKLEGTVSVECDVLFLSSSISALGAPLVIEGNFTYSNCGAGCSVTEEGGPAVLEILKEGHETASVVGEGEIHINCFGINCYYNGEGLTAVGKGPLLSTATNGEGGLTGQVLHKVKGTFCQGGINGPTLRAYMRPLAPVHIGN